MKGQKRQSTIRGVPDIRTIKNEVDLVKERRSFIKRSFRTLHMLGIGILRSSNYIILPTNFREFWLVSL